VALQSKGETEAAATHFADAARALSDLSRLGCDAKALGELHYLLGRGFKAAGGLESARVHYAAALEAVPDAFAARVSLAVALRHLGRPDEAELHLRRAVGERPDGAEGLANLGMLLLESGREAEAAPLLDRALALRPDLVAVREAAARAHHATGEARRIAGAPDDAERSYRRALALSPARLETLDNLGALLAQRGRPREAVPMLAQAAALAPDSPVTLANLGRALLAEGRPRDALAPLARALELAPSAHIWSDRGEALRRLERWEEAQSALLVATQIDPLGVEPRSRLGFVYLDQGRLFEAERELQRAAGLDPESAAALANHGVALYLCNRLDEAAERLGRALERAPELYFARVALALAHLKRGDFERGWEGYEWRWKGAEKLAASVPGLNAPRWEGEPAQGRVVLLYGEQGFGDELQFVRHARQVAARGARVWLLAQPPLRRLFSRLPEIERVYAFGDPIPPFDLHCPLLSLPRALGVRLESIPREVPYLSAPSASVSRWRRRIGHEPRLKVGLAWAGGAREDDPEAMRVDARRSLRLARLAPLAGIPGVRWFSLQKGPPAEQAAAPPEGMELTDWSGELEDFEDTAALIECLDLVLSVDTAVAHLAGALGRPVWVLSRFDGCWRWLDGRADSPWYPTMRIFRQQAPLDWSAPLDEVAQSLAALARSRSAA
jgi:Flp pilus assembly protein TadD